MFLKIVFLEVLLILGALYCSYTVYQCSLLEIERPDFLSEELGRDYLKI
jgi:hypothetical protein